MAPLESVLGTDTSTTEEELSLEEMLRRVLRRLLQDPPKTDWMASRIDRLEQAIVEGLRRSRSRTFGSNG